MHTVATCTCIHYIVVTWARVVCLIYTPKARGPQARGLRVYISGKPRVPMLQLLCTTYLQDRNPRKHQIIAINSKPTIIYIPYLLGY